MKDTSPKVIKAIREYQEPGAVGDFDPKNFEQNGAGVEWSSHTAGTMIFPGVGTIFLGMPNGFNRLNQTNKQMPLNIFKTFDDKEKVWHYDMWNVPIWKYLNKKGHTLVRGLSPRINRPFLHVILENCMNKINCLEITQNDVETMD